jgi:hypothetical protein
MQLFQILRIKEPTGKPAIGTRSWSGATDQREGVTMNTGLYRIEWSRSAAPGGRSSGWPGRVIDYFTINYFTPGLILLAVVLMAGCGAWMVLSDGGGDAAESEPARLAAAEPEATVPPATAATQQGALPNMPATPAEAAPADGLKISSQHWRRGGLGSNALVTFTLRNGNHYAVRDIEISCAFSRADGSHLTDRTRVIHDTVRGKGRKTFTRLHIGFVNVNAEHARCEPVAARRLT